MSISDDPGRPAFSLVFVALLIFFAGLVIGIFAQWSTP